MQVKVLKAFWDSADKRNRKPGSVVEIADANVERWQLIETGKVERVQAKRGPKPKVEKESDDSEE